MGVADDSSAAFINNPVITSGSIFGNATGNEITILIKTESVICLMIFMGIRDLVDISVTNKSYFSCVVNPETGRLIPIVPRASSTFTGRR